MVTTPTSVDAFLLALGFLSDPFELTNADSEPLLAAYFVPPPFFSSVLGDPQNPRPVAVFAPRGTGKTAQRLSVEQRSIDNGDFLVLTYDDFGITTKKDLAEVDLNYHRRQIIIRLTLALLSSVERDPGAMGTLSKHARQVLLHCAREYLGRLSQLEYSVALSSVKTLNDRGKEIWAKYGGVVATWLLPCSRRLSWMTW